VDPTEPPAQPEKGWRKKATKTEEDFQKKLKASPGNEGPSTRSALDKVAKREKGDGLWGAADQEKGGGGRNVKKPRPRRKVQLNVSAGNTRA